MIVSEIWVKVYSYPELKIRRTTVQIHFKQEHPNGQVRAYWYNTPTKCVGPSRPYFDSVLHLVTVNPSVDLRAWRFMYDPVTMQFDPSKIESA